MMEKATIKSRKKIFTVLAIIATIIYFLPISHAIVRNEDYWGNQIQMLINPVFLSELISDYGNYQGGSFYIFTAGLTNQLLLLLLAVPILEIMAIVFFRKGKFKTTLLLQTLFLVYSVFAIAQGLILNDPSPYHVFSVLASFAHYRPLVTSLILPVVTGLSVSVCMKEVKSHKKPIKVEVVAKDNSNADELKKYKELLDMGAITQEEFDAKKKELLNL